MRSILLLGLTSLAFAEVALKPPPEPWSEKAALSFVSTAGNAEASTFGFTNEFIYRWSTSQLQFLLSGVRINTTTFARSAKGTSLSDYTVEERRTTDTTSESYLAGLRYDHKLPVDFFWYAATGWERNLPTGLEGRIKGNTGVGRAWLSGPSTKFRTDLGFGYLHENPVFKPVGFQGSFATWNFNARFEQKIGSASSFASDLAFIGSLLEGKDHLAVWKNALSSSLNSHFALKVGLDFNYRGKPASIGLDVVQTGSNPPVVLGQVPFQLKKLDTVFTTSLVLTF